MDISICSYSFHRLLAAGKQDIFQYIDTCKDLGCTQLDPWNAHLATLRKGDEAVKAEPGKDGSHYLSADDDAYITKVKQAGDKVGLPFGCIAVDGAEIFNADESKRQTLRARAYRWLEIAGRLGAKQIRVDAGGPEDMTDTFATIKEGYIDLITRGKRRGVNIVVENHWGPTIIPDNVVKLLENIPGLGLLWDSHNWKPELRAEGRRKCAKFATITHLKTFAFDAAGNETTAEEDAAGALKILKDAGYKGCWGVESVPKDGDEIAGARKTIALIRKIAG
jgi:sugar phosphate isomerase/epimerase